MHEDCYENHRLRKCTLYYYLEDGTLEIREARIQNFGINQGLFLKRHLVPKPDSIMSYTWEDLNLGIDIEVFGRVFRIYDCDNFTRAFYSSQNVELNPAEQPREDNFIQMRKAVGPIPQRDPLLTTDYIRTFFSVES